MIDMSDVYSGKWPARGPLWLKRVFCCVASVCLAMSLAGCTSGVKQVETEADDEEGVQSERIASSLEAQIDRLLKLSRNDSSYDAFQREALERAKETGRVSDVDYEKAWSNVKQCLYDLGYKEVLLIKYPNGVYRMANVGPSDVKVTSQMLDKWREDKADCMFENVVDVDGIYRLQTANPSLYGNRYEAVADCLRRAEVVSKDYTAARFQEDEDKGDYGFDVSDPEAAGCLASNHSSVDGMYGSDTVMHPFG
ncbi:hypothetical protein JS533_006010 [Bifidobacterium amazonense]|uniref:Lipoprotein n=1 Tax=Bifidobacterium amazonense TaxID=2809027 RepID=A0ABS9VVI6_9BIFI|nr:hypothetical protein [Bifidobacterium amazonense]MCH9275825.1 hypothetical protein [Bifidobacterium amazonense]